MGISHKHSDVLTGRKASVSTGVKPNEQNSQSRGPEGKEPSVSRGKGRRCRDEDSRARLCGELQALLSRWLSREWHGEPLEGAVRVGGIRSALHSEENTDF